MHIYPTPPERCVAFRNPRVCVYSSVCTNPTPFSSTPHQPNPTQPSSTLPTPFHNNKHPPRIPSSKQQKSTIKKTKTRWISLPEKRKLRFFLGGFFRIRGYSMYISKKPLFQIHLIRNVSFVGSSVSRCGNQSHFAAMGSFCLIYIFFFSVRASSFFYWGL